MAITKTITWNGVVSSTIPDLVIGQITRSLVGSLRGTFVDVPGFEGSWFFTDRRGRRTLTAQCFIEADTIAARRGVVEDVANWLDVEIQAYLAISDEPGVYYEAVLAEVPEPDEWRELAMFELTWAINPYALDDNISTETFVADADETHTWDPGLDVFCYPVITITPTNGTVIGFELLVNDVSLVYGGTILDDQSITINSIAAVLIDGVNDDVELVGAYDPGNVTFGDISGEFPVLLAGGNNTIRFLRSGGTATTITVTTVYRKRYRK